MKAIILASLLIGGTLAQAEEVKKEVTSTAPKVESAQPAQAVQPKGPEAAVTAKPADAKSMDAKPADKKMVKGKAAVGGKKSAHSEEHKSEGAPKENK